MRLKKDLQPSINLFQTANFMIADPLIVLKCTLSRENLSSGFPSKRDSNQSLRLQRLARKLNFRL